VLSVPIVLLVTAIGGGGPAWQPLLRCLLGTCVVTVGAAGVVLPVALGAIVWVRYLAPRWLQGPLRLGLRALGSIPSVVFGLVGVLFVAQAAGALTAALPSSVVATGVLAVVALPRVARHIDRELGALPQVRMEAALALGASHTEALLRVILPGAWRGIAMAGILGGVRALGDTMVVWMFLGASRGVLLGPVHTLTTELVGSFHSGDRAAAAALGLVLVLLGAGGTLAVRPSTEAS